MKIVNTVVLENNLKQIENYIPDYEKINPAISKANVAWHLDHNLKVINAVITNMKASDVTLFRNNFSFLGKVFFTLGFFPKGKAKAPKHVMPPEIIVKEDIIKQLMEAIENIKEIDKLSKNSYFRHPLFGHIPKRRVVRFLNIHTNHHLKIIKNILN